MHRLILLAALATNVVAVAQRNLSPPQGTLSSRTSKSFIVELDYENNLGTHGNDPHEQFYSHVKTQTHLDVRREYNMSGLFVGASITLDSPIELSSIPGVVAVYPVSHMRRPQPIKAVIFSGPDDPRIPKDSESTHIMTGVDKLHAQGILGKGVTFGLIDTGVDYTHPLLGGRFGPGHKIKGGHDFVGDDYNGTNTPVPDPDPLDQCNGHGTHVAGILAADPDSTFNISGVAYEASIQAYRVFGCTGSVANDVVIDALLRAVQDDVNIISMSLGGASGWTTDPVSVLVSRIVARGIVVVAANGNVGMDGPWDANSPATGLGVIAVNSVINSVTPAQRLTTSDPTHSSIVYFSLLSPADPGPFHIYATSNDTTIIDDACSPLPDSTPDLSNLVVVVRRGTCPFTTKLQNIADKGGNLTLIYNTDDTAFAPDVGNFTAFGISASDGAFLVAQFAANNNITVSFPPDASVSVPNSDGGLTSTFNTWSPTYDLYQKPQLSAPGENIASTFPVPLGSFALLSGTSMATPFISGCVALIMQVEGKDLGLAQRVSNLLQTTAQLVPSSNNGSGPLQTATSQGAGLVNVYNALTAKTMLSPSELLLNDTKHFVGQHTLTITNLHQTYETYEIQHNPAGTANTMNGTLAIAGPPVLTKEYATVRFSSNRITVPPGESLDVHVNIEAPKNLDATKFPTYSGFTVITGVRYGEKLHATYAGVVGDMKAMKIIDDTETILGMRLPAIIDASGNIQVKPTNYTFVGNDTPSLVYRLAAGTPLAAVNLVDPNFKVPHSGGSMGLGLVGNLISNSSLARNAVSDDPEASPLMYELELTPTFSNGSQIPDGFYKVLLQVLKITGNQNIASDYETFLSPVIGIFPRL